MAVETSSADRERPPGDEGRYGERIFRPGDSGEADRIDHGALAYDAITLARLRRLGAGPGWRCLDVGAGTGSVARALLRDAGVAEVVAADRDTRFLAEDPPEGLVPLEADVLADDFDPGRFDLVHARFVLMHLPDPARMTARLAGLLAPGGVLVVGDAVDLTTGAAPDGPVTAAVRAMWRGLRDTIGTDVSWVPDCPRLLTEAGLESVAAEIHVPPLEAGSPISRFWADTWERSRDAMTATGLVDDEGLDGALRSLGAAEFAGFSPGMLTAWGRAPGAAN